MKKLASVIIAALFSVGVMADEGMWLLPFLQKMNMQDMQEKGLELSAEEIYSVNQNSLKDAVVIFGGGCTGEIVSPNGLLFTNHHCGYGDIQALSSVENDYLKNGYWAMNRGEELPAKGLKARFVREFIDVTDIVLKGADKKEGAIEKNIKKLTKKLQRQNKGKEISIKPFFGGNQYFASIIEIFPDVRFVGAPPSSIGKFGGETDNWMWPRHTGDFAVFRIYADKDNNPAEYSAENVPYNSPTHLTISTEGYEEGDFAMILGFPGTTKRYMTSYEIDQTLNVSNPSRIYIRGERQNILSEQMKASDKVRIQYASKYARSSNYWKNSIGMSRGLKKLNVKDEKEAIERAFVEWIGNNPARVAKYGEALPLIRDAVAEMTPLQGEGQIITETMFNIEVAFRNARTVKRDFKSIDTVKIDALYKDYDEATDKKVTLRMLEIAKEMLPVEALPSVFAEVIEPEFGGDLVKYVDYIYANSMFANRERCLEAMKTATKKQVDNDPATVLGESTLEKYLEYSEKIYGDVYDRFKKGHKLFIAGLMEMEPDAMHYPDANFTLRLTYGNIFPYSPADGVEYKYFTTLKGIMDKEDTTNPVEFTVPAKLKELYYAKDFGDYVDEDGTLHVAFLSNNDITGGNSGSPIMNGKGELIGIAFDGNWEAMSGDIAFEPALQRTINVDIRYVLFIIDKYGEAGYLLDEMTIK